MNRKRKLQLMTTGRGLRAEPAWGYVRAVTHCDTIQGDAILAVGGLRHHSQTPAPARAYQTARPAAVPGRPARSPRPVVVSK
jgi:hypothetical protein